MIPRRPKRGTRLTNKIQEGKATPILMVEST